jgi:hypothetical protein
MFSSPLALVLLYLVNCVAAAFLVRRATRLTSAVVNGGWRSLLASSLRIGAFVALACALGSWLLADFVSIERMEFFVGVTFAIVLLRTISRLMFPGSVRSGDIRAPVTAK